jgi:antitoxin component YwqK of YwqJK toxin-antitoxin module
MSEFDYIVEETKLDGEIEAAKYIAEHIVNRLREHELNPGTGDLIYYTINGYLQELVYLKNNPM